MTRLALSALLAALALFGTASPALAHTELTSSDPANGAVLPQRPTRLTLTFTEPVPAESATITVTGPDGSAWPLGEVGAEGTSLVVPMKQSGAPAGQYRLTWMVQSLDGDFVDGVITFTMPAPAAAQPPPTTATASAPTTTTTGAAASTTTGAPTTTTTTTTSAAAVPEAAREDDGGGVPLWVWIAAAVVLVAIGVAIALGRRKGESEPGAGASGAGASGTDTEPAE
ncbi:copper resistance CopC family protein [Saccharothrix syringae]|uniref:Copper resistance protein CopC n=1 Tax=Saccharothrix syringae TaxID=103733 RepID=A0A5Q0GVJ9_SACSY|nr:copper resistance CopC family protein [Saccharothrix syringae]QFZ17999.1 copper resistance protein CopC [Saccharothrix syringae]